MKKLFVVITVLALLVAMTVPAMAAKPDGPPGLMKLEGSNMPPGQTVRELVHERNMLAKEERNEFQKEKENGAVKYDFYLSGEVMPSGVDDDYGKADIEGSDEGSKLIVNQPNGDIAASVTGVMKGLEPMTDYTVFVSNGYTPNIEWNVVGKYVIYLNDGYKLDSHDIEITSQVDGILEGTGGYFIEEGTYINEGIITGTIDGNVVTLHSGYTAGEPEYYYDVVLTIEPDGTMNGTWLANGEDIDPARTLLISGEAVKVNEGSDSYTELLNEDLLPPFTFTTDEEGHASWHVNLTDEMLVFVEGEAEFSVWINNPSDRTILISETVVIEED